MKKIPYHSNENGIIGSYYPVREGMKGAPRFNRPVSPRDNFRAAITEKKPLWYPTTHDYELFMTRIIPDNVARAMWNDIAGDAPDPEKGGKDMYGVDWVYMPDGGGSMVKPGKPLFTDANNWKEHVFKPDIESWGWENAARLNTQYAKKDEDRLISSIQFTGLFERLVSFMDFENAAIALVDEEQQEAVKELFSLLIEVHMSIIAHAKQYFNIDMVLFHDDWGSQRNSFFSTGTCREMIAPFIRKLVDFCHDNGIIFEMHSCGRIEGLVPVMIECGVDMWAGQSMNDFKMLYEKYGDRIMLGIRLQNKYLDDSVPEDQMRVSIAELLNTFGKPDKPVYFAVSYSAPYNSRYTQLLYEMSRKHLLEQ